MKYSQLLLNLIVTTSLVTTACSKFKSDQPESPPDSTQNQGGDANAGQGGGDSQGGNTNPGNDNSVTPVPVAGEDTCNLAKGTYNLKSVRLNPNNLFTKSLSMEILSDNDQIEILKMKVTENEDCKCGSWESFTTNRPWTLKYANQVNTVSVQFKDFEGRISQCTKLSITHDDLAPKVTATLDSTNDYQEPAATKVNIDSVDSGSGIRSVTCKLNGSAVACPAGAASLSFSAQPTGAYNFEITAVDNLGFSSSASLNWSVVTPYKNVVQNYEVKSNDKVDILIIDDNSGSMEYEQKSMAKRMASFLGVLAGLDWRIGITTTDPDDVSWGDGRLVKTEGPLKEWFISSQMDAQKAKTSLEQSLQRKETGSSEEQGIRATYRSIERSMDPQDPNSSFYRNDAHFAAVVISDEDESDNQFRNIPENLLTFVNRLWPQKNFAFHSIITRPGDTRCKNDQGYSYGYTYAKMSNLTGNGMIGGAIIGSVCETDYGSQLAGIGNSVQAMQKIIDLECMPLGEITSSVNVSLNNSNYPDPYEVVGQRLIFKNALPVGAYSLEYKCAK